ncbi:hypothetical protein KIW84_043169, partial [Lathyrus oleraceus]
VSVFSPIPFASNPSYPLSLAPETSQQHVPNSLLSLAPIPQLASFHFSLIVMPKAKSDSKAVDSRLKRKGAGTGRKQSKKAAKDPNKPKRPPSAFFVFMADFREQYKKDHPNNKSVAAVGKACGEEWKSLSEEDKAPYVARALKKKEEYEITLQAYNKKLEGKDDEEGSDKSKSEVNDEDEDEEDDDDE